MPKIDCDIHCIECGANLEGLDSRDTCLSCGANIAITLHCSSVRVEDLTLRGHITCLGCDYDLRSLPIASRCPECARPAADSLRGEYLLRVDRKWLEAVASGVSLLRDVTVLLTTLPLAGAIGITLDEISSQFPLLQAITPVVLLYLALAPIALYVAFAFAMGQCLLVRPAGVADHRGRTVDWIGLAGSLAPFLALVFLASTWTVQFPPVGLMLALALAGPIMAVGCLFIRLRVVAACAGREELVRKSRMVFRLAWVVTVLSIGAAYLVEIGLGMGWIGSVGLLLACVDAFLCCALWVMVYANLTDFRALLNGAVAMR